jgi:hypothetical protein
MAEQGMSRNEAAAPGRALVSLGAAHGAAKPASVAALAPDAAFLTQLIACRAAAPAYRQRRRAEPGVAAACYRSALALA